MPKYYRPRTLLLSDTARRAMATPQEVCSRSRGFFWRVVFKEALVDLDEVLGGGGLGWRSCR